MLSRSLGMPSRNNGPLSIGDTHETFFFFETENGTSVNQKNTCEPCSLVSTIPRPPTSAAKGMFKDVWFYTILNFGLFWAPSLLQDVLVLPHQKFWPFSGRPLKDVLECFQIFGPASSPHTVFIISCVFLLSLALVLAAFFVSGPCSLHVLLSLAWLPLPMVTGFFEIAQSYQHRTAKKTKKTKHRRKPK